MLRLRDWKKSVCARYPGAKFVRGDTRGLWWAVVQGNKIGWWSGAGGAYSMF
jgi:hypothetical protein